MSKSDEAVFFDGENTRLWALSKILVDAVKIVLRQKGDIYLTVEPMIREKAIIQFSNRMRVDGLEKFNGRTFVATVNFYIDKSHMEHEKAVGALILYIPEGYVARLMWLMEYGRIDEDDEHEMLESCGTVANLIAGCFVKELSANGYVSLQMSHFETFVNTPVNGVCFSSQEEVKHEIEFTIRGERRLMAELTMAPLKRY